MRLSGKQREATIPLTHSNMLEEKTTIQVSITTEHGITILRSEGLFAKILSA